VTIGRRLLGLVAELVLPGAGSYALGRRIRAATVLALTLLAVAACVTAAVVGLLGLLWASFALFLIVRLAGLLVAATGSHSKPPTKLEFAAVCAIAWLSLWAGRVFVKSHLIEAFKVPSGSMYPTISPGDHIMVSKLARVPLRGDIVALHQPADWEGIWVKRVIGLPGDRVRCGRDGIVLNGEPLRRIKTDEPCRETPPCTVFEERVSEKRYLIAVAPDSSPPLLSGEVQIPAEHVFVVGDNRNNSLDSCAVGPIALDAVVGSYSLTWWSNHR